MPPKSLNKVQKQIAKKKGASTALHEKSRDYRRLQRASAREEKVHKLVASRDKQNDSFLSRVAFFHGEAKLANRPQSISEMQDMIARYIERSANELASVKSERRPGRPPSIREHQLRMRIDQEQREYRSGFWMPDLEDPKNLEALLEWHGEWAGLAPMNFVRIYHDGTKKESTFPPNGQS
ncbi:hypothetical protein P152DRAFT_399783 [Eremomyces bilateralis CBS 781.70]|uniref:Translation machinery-associated protein 16 n=1 Tax=Eremomyces bilateralis CBS 781.70 TaxID=1392243 RepID=A0A6G1G063_9PEZI|nr:uncharacterized protein P152DRAFT_399783 [Eremomyces bilateralis CBS 781.70]KAF1811316.1 hypothetical protein P152DRAFT_399783 [Eremomyces bilateralis CBS 781.70]